MLTYVDMYGSSFYEAAVQICCADGLNGYEAESLCRSFSRRSGADIIAQHANSCARARLRWAPERYVIQTGRFRLMSQLMSQPSRFVEFRSIEFRQIRSSSFSALLTSDKIRGLPKQIRGIPAKFREHFVKLHQIIPGNLENIEKK